MNNFGDLIRAKREENEMLLRHLAAQLDIDTAQLSKMERGERTAKREHVLRLIQILKLDKSETKSLWLADQIFKSIATEDEAIRALDIAKLQIEKAIKNRTQ